MALVKDLGARLQAAASRLANPVRDLVRDAVGLFGAGLVAWGAGEIYKPAGLIVAGLFLLAAAWLWAKASDAKPSSDGAA